MRIFEIGTGYTPIPAKIGAATEIVAEELTKALLEMGEQVQIIDIASDDRGRTDLPIQEVPVPNCFRRTDVKLGLLHKLKRVVYSVALAAKLRRILKTSKEQVVLHFHNQYNFFFFLLLTSGKLRQRCLTAYTNHSGIWRRNWSDIRKTIRRRYFQEAVCMQRADIVFLLNRQTREKAVEQLGVPEQRTVLIGNGVNTQIYRPLSPAEKEEAREKWNFSECRVILQVGSVNENKGQLRTAEQLLPVLKAHPELVYAYAGAVVEEACQESIQALAQFHGLTRQIRYLGVIPPGKEMNALYNAADVTILPSRFESFGLVAVESMAAGVPVLLEKNGLVRFPEGAVFYAEAELGDTVEQLLQMDASVYEGQCARARAFAASEYSWNRIADGYRKAFEDRMKQLWQKS